MTLLDSNILIYAIQPAHAALRASIAADPPAVSEVSRVEVYGYHKLTPADAAAFDAVFPLCTELPVTRAVIDRAVSLRQQRRMDLGDALIAATALVHGLALVTHNTADFAWIPGLTVLDPLAP